MIEVDKDKLIKICNWDKHQNVQGMERVRDQKRKELKTIEKEKNNLKNLIKTMAKRL